MKRYWKKVRQYFDQLKKDEKSGKVFAEGFCKEKLFLIFVVASVFGTYYEQILNFVKYYFQDGRIFWEYRRGVLYGPFSPVYGMGAVLMVVVLGRKQRPWYQLIGYGSLLGGAFEFMISFLQELVTGTTSWDYSQHFLNINGRTTIPFMLAWGIFTFVFIKGIYPFLAAMIEKIPYAFGSVAVFFLSIFFVFNCLISWTAILRGTLRKEHHPPYTPVGKFYDRVYPDPVLRHHFPNMEFGKR